MRALLSHTSGPPSSLSIGNLPLPEPAPGTVRIRVAACGINYPDVLLCDDRYQVRPPRPFAPGGEVAGVVDALGDGVTGLEVGARVLALTGWGGLAEAVIVPTAHAVAIPDAMSFETAAGFLLTYATSHHALHGVGALRAGETVLVLGAAGGVGRAAVELAVAGGARVVAGVSSEAKAVAARADGAEAVVVYGREPEPRALAAEFKAACGPGGADVCYDPVGGVWTEAALRALAWRGRHLVIGFPAGIAALPLNLVLLKEAQVLGVFWGAWVGRDPVGHAAVVADLLRLWTQGHLHPEPAEVYPLEHGAEAIARLASREAIGKLVVRLS